MAQRLDYITKLKKREFEKRIRVATRAWRRRPCYVCFNHESITHLHHIMPVQKVIDMLLEDDKDASEAPVQFVVWMCPNCHAYAHRLDLAMKKDGILSTIPPFIRASLLNLLEQTHRKMEEYADGSGKGEIILLVPDPAPNEISAVLDLFF